MGNGPREKFDGPHLCIRRDLLQQIVAHCRHSYPLEACGIVSGRAGRAERVYGTVNIHPRPDRHFLIAADEQRAVFRDMKVKGHELVALFHSHPRTPAHPSATDIELAFYPDAFYIIVSMAAEPPDVRAFRIDRSRRTVRIVHVHVYD